jgi:twitching motility protein PilJ
MARAADRIVAEGGTPAEALDAGRQLAQLQALESILDRLLTSGASGFGAIDKATSVATEVAASLDRLSSKSTGREQVGAQRALQETTSLFKDVRADVEQMLGMAPAALTALDAVSALQTASEKLDRALDNLAGAYRQAPRDAMLGPVALGPWSVPLFGALALLCVLFLGARALLEAQRREAASRAQTDRDEQAILRLLGRDGRLGRRRLDRRGDGYRG